MRTNEGWLPERHVPLLAGLAELVLWLKQWPDDLEPATGERPGTRFAAFVADEVRELGSTIEELGARRPTATTSRRPRRKNA
jgi:hypothetical protein